jgi:integrase
MRLFGKPERRYSLDAGSAAQIFRKEFNKALDQLEDEREQASTSGYDFGDIRTFLDVHEEVYRHLAETVCMGAAPSASALTERSGTSDENILRMAEGQLAHLSAIWHQNLDETAEALEAEKIETDIFYMDHAMRLRFEARLAAVQEFRRRLDDKNLRFQSLLASAPHQIVGNDADPLVVAVRAPDKETEEPDDPAWAGLTAEQAAAKFIAENPKLLPSPNGKREGRWTEKTRSQFETTMRLLQKSMGTKPFTSLSNNDLKRLLEHFERLPLNHHKSPRHVPMTLEEICAEAKREVSAGRLKKNSLGLNVPTLNRHFRFIRMAHDWMRRQVPHVQELDWKAYSFGDERTAREQRDAFPVDIARKIFRLPPWHGCANRRQRFSPGREVYHDSVYWVLPIIWYSGMRRGEACKLQVSDVADSEDGIWHFVIDVTDAGRLKTSSSRRRVPIADELLRLGFLDFVAALKSNGETLLFPELAGDTRPMGDTYYRHCWQKLLELLEVQPDGLTLHGVRHMVADELKHAGFNEEVRADLLGHALQSETAGRYSKASRLSALKQAVNAIPIVTKSVRAERTRLISSRSG